jgi:hypothetical protein
MGEGPCGSSSNCLRVWSGLEYAGELQDVGTGRSQTGGARKEWEYERRPNQMPGHHLGFN